MDPNGLSYCGTRWIQMDHLSGSTEWIQRLDPDGSIWLDSRDPDGSKWTQWIQMYHLDQNGSKMHHLHPTKMDPS